MSDLWPALGSENHASLPLDIYFDLVETFDVEYRTLGLRNGANCD